MDECKFAAEMKSNVLPTVKDVIGHYIFVRNSLMCSTKNYLHKRPEFNDEVVGKIEAIRENSSLPTKGRKSMETKLRNVLKKYAVIKAGCRTVSNNGSGSGIAPAQNILAVQVWFGVT